MLEHHGWEDVAEALAERARRGRWADMAELIDDRMLHAFAVVVGVPGELRDALERHAAGLIDRIAPYAGFGTPPWSALGR